MTEDIGLSTSQGETGDEKANSVVNEPPWCCFPKKCLNAEDSQNAKQEGLISLLLRQQQEVLQELRHYRKATKDEIGDLVRASIKQHLRPRIASHRVEHTRNGSLGINKPARRRCKRTRSCKARTVRLSEPSGNQVSGRHDGAKALSMQTPHNTWCHDKLIIRQRVEQQPAHVDVSLDGLWLPSLPSPGLDKALNSDGRWAERTASDHVPPRRQTGQLFQKENHCLRPSTVPSWNPSMPYAESVHTSQGDNRPTTTGHRKRVDHESGRLSSISGNEISRQRDELTDVSEGDNAPGEKPFLTSAASDKQGNKLVGHERPNLAEDYGGLPDSDVYNERRGCKRSLCEPVPYEPQDEPYYRSSDEKTATPMCQNTAAMLERSRALVTRAKASCGHTTRYVKAEQRERSETRSEIHQEQESEIGQTRSILFPALASNSPREGSVHESRSSPQCPNRHDEGCEHFVEERRCPANESTIEDQGEKEGVKVKNVLEVHAHSHGACDHIKISEEFTEIHVNDIPREASSGLHDRPVSLPSPDLYEGVEPKARTEPYETPSSTRPAPAGQSATSACIRYPEIACINTPLNQEKGEADTRSGFRNANDIIVGDGKRAESLTGAARITSTGSPTKIDIEWENEIAKNILSLYQTKLKDELEKKRGANRDELKSHGYLTFEEEKAIMQKKRCDAIVNGTHRNTSPCISSKGRARSGTAPVFSPTKDHVATVETYFQAQDNISLQIGRVPHAVGIAHERATVAAGTVSQSNVMAKKSAGYTRPKTSVKETRFSDGASCRRPNTVAASAARTIPNDSRRSTTSAAVGTMTGRGGFRGSKTISVPTRRGETAIVVPKRPTPIWFAGSGAIQAEWSALPGGLRVVRDLESLEEQGRYSKYVAVVEGLLVAHLRADSLEGPTELAKKLWRQLVVTCTAFGVRSIESRRFERALELLKRAGILLSRQVLDKRTTSELRAFVSDAYGLYYLRRGKSSAALDYLQKAMRTHARMQDWGHVSKCHLHSAVVLSRLTRHDEALRCLGQVLSMVEEGKLDVGGNSPQKLCLVAICYHNIAVEQLIMRHVGDACMSSQNARRLARLCLSYSNRWLHSFEGTHKLALAELAKSLPSPAQSPASETGAGSDAATGRTDAGGGAVCSADMKSDNGSAAKQRELLQRLTEELFS